MATCSDVLSISSSLSAQPLASLVSLRPLFILPIKMITIHRRKNPSYIQLNVFRPDNSVIQYDLASVWKLVLAYLDGASVRSSRRRLSVLV